MRDIAFCVQALRCIVTYGFILSASCAPTVTSPVVDGRVDDSTIPDDSVDTAADSPPIRDTSDDCGAPADGELCPPCQIAAMAIPYNSVKGCREAEQFYECQPSRAPPGEGCFVRISTGVIYLIDSVRPPSGPDIRSCTAAEQSAVTLAPRCEKDAGAD